MKKAIPSLLAVAFAITTLASYNNNEDNANATTYVLVHGAWQAPFVWNAVRSDLVEKGNKVIVVELPGHGNDKTPPHTLSLDAYRDKVIEAISAVHEKVILVGHSLSGMVVTAVAEKVPSKISKLVYIGAFLPASGQALADLAQSDPGSQLGPSLVQSADQLTLDVKADSLTYLFINDGTAAVKQQVIDNYRAEPAIPFANKVTLTNEGFGSVNKVYIKTLQDHVISPGLQDRMIAGAHITTVFTLNTSHSPFLSQPHEVSKLLLRIASQPAKAAGEAGLPPLKQQQAIARLTRYDVKPEYQEQFRKVVTDYVSHAIAIESNIMAEAYYEKENHSTLWIIERWAGHEEWMQAKSNTQSKALIRLAEMALVKPPKSIQVKDLEPISKQQWRRTAKTADSQLTIMLFVDAKAGTQETFKNVYHKAMPQFRGEPGVITYQLSEFEEDDTQFVTYEKFRSNEAFQYHLNFPPIKPVLDYLHSSIKKQPFQDGIHNLIEFAPLTRE